MHHWVMDNSASSQEAVTWQGYAATPGGKVGHMLLNRMVCICLPCQSLARRLCL